MTDLILPKNIIPLDLLDFFEPICSNKTSTLRVNTQPHPEAHFACYPEELITTPIKAGCPPLGIVLDPFFGSGTTGKVCQDLHRHWIGCELEPESMKIAERKLNLD